MPLTDKDGNKIELRDKLLVEVEIIHINSDSILCETVIPFKGTGAKSTMRINGYQASLVP